MLRYYWQNVMFLAQECSYIVKLSWHYCIQKVKNDDVIFRCCAEYSQRLLSGEILGFLLKNGVQYNIGSRDADNFTTDDFDKQ